MCVNIQSHAYMFYRFEWSYKTICFISRLDALPQVGLLKIRKWVPAWAAASRTAGLDVDFDMVKASVKTGEVLI